MARGIRTNVRLVNFVDEVLSQHGIIRPEEVRSFELDEAVVDTGSTRLVLTDELVQRLVLPIVSEITVRYADHRTARKPIAKSVLVEVLGRDSIFDAVVEDQGEPLIGIEVLEAMDLWPDPQRGFLTTNPLSSDIPLYNLL